MPIIRQGAAGSAGLLFSTVNTLLSSKLISFQISYLANTVCSSLHWNRDCSRDSSIVKSLNQGGQSWRRRHYHRRRSSDVKASPHLYAAPGAGGSCSLNRGFDSLTGAGPGAVPIRRCVQCGEVIDPVILQNRRLRDKTDPRRTLK
jgi:hypothetical protein